VNRASASVQPQQRPQEWNPLLLLVFKLHFGSVGLNVARKLLEDHRLHHRRNLGAIHIVWEGSENRT
jgi:hypothetical protein